MPSLTAQHPEYFVTTMQAYKSGDRTDNMMQMLVATLDDAAIRIVKMAAPYPPLPSDIKQDTDILHIPRVWRFKNTGRLTFN